ncbi:ABC-F family ATP-binding cassette domain-containing protein [Cohnella thailandensis]|uniref:ATP-binding cassette domain-containing protein n=1 Tax=Cohnella thailandensis TaxID=557557 RepID=A0A841SXH8_9BACL|nr:ABC-F family ATP-binding cassette domain-containing protein [Cohnella thailandensis]MBB6633451.1 ATP-binding cassette domain-containing protein [Cohnella thailandensis]MBP1974466.1 ATP-binding cassette subfamily F protein 3 [Cohnella thailandensis]
MLLQASGITKHYGVTPVLEGLSLLINERDRIGLVGVNGAGKSTFLRILAGELTADSGSVSKPREVKIGYLAQNSSFDGRMTIQEVMYDAFGPLLEQERELRRLEERMADPAEQEDAARYEALLGQYADKNDRFRDAGGFEMDTRIRSVLHGMGFGDFPRGTPVGSLSGGQRTRLALARLLVVQPELLLLDEPTNHLDIATLTWLEQYLRTYSGAMVIVSHDRYFLDATVTSIVEIERHQATRYTGNYTRFMEQKAADFAQRVKLYEQQKKEIARMEDFIQRNLVRATTTRRAQSRRNALERIERLEKPGTLKQASFSFTTERRTGKDVLQVSEASASPSEELAPLFKGVSFEAKRGERIALLGPNGIGKTTLLKALVGSLPLRKGTIRWGTGVMLGYYDQEQKQLNKANTVLEEVWSEYPMLPEAEIRTVLGNFLFSGEDVKKTVGSLSGGEKARVALSKLMLRKANVLVLDEPTNHLDLWSREVLEAALEEYDGTLLFVSHDRYFLNRLADRIVELHPEGAKHFLGNYDDMVAKKQELEQWRAEAASPPQAGTAAASPAPVQDYEAEKQAKREERARQRKKEQAEADIARLEEEIAAFEKEMAQEEVFSDYVLLREKQAEVDKRRQALDEAYEIWESLLD